MCPVYTPVTGGVFVSGPQLPAQALQSESMSEALSQIWDKADQHRITLRTATYAVSCERILTARQARGPYP